MPVTAFTYGDPKSLGITLQRTTPTFHGGIEPGVAPGASIPSWGTWDMAPGTVGIAYQMEWYLEGCAIPVTFTLTSGSLPPGLSLSTLTGAEGEISGTPTTVGTYSFSLKATNAFGSASKSFSITISAAPSGGSWTFLA